MRGHLFSLVSGDTVAEELEKGIHFPGQERSDTRGGSAVGNRQPGASLSPQVTSSRPHPIQGVRPLLRGELDRSVTRGLG